MKTAREILIKNAQDNYYYSQRFLSNRVYIAYKIFEDAVMYELSNGSQGKPLPDSLNYSGENLDETDRFLQEQRKLIENYETR